MMRFSRFVAAILLALLPLWGMASAGIAGEPGSASVSQEKRIALVIGNADYRLSPLATPLNDAGLVAQTLAQAGFDVTAMGNADGDRLRKIMHDFIGKVREAGPDAVVFVYLAGYGLQFDGDNYFVPVDARIDRDVDVPASAVRLSDLVQQIEEIPARARVFVDDLARATPFAKIGQPLAGGLVIPAPTNGAVTAFNAAPGTVAVADAVPYGVYARALAEMIQEPAMPLDVMFERVRLRVSERTDGATIPWTTGNSDFVFYPERAPATPAGSPPAAPTAVAPTPMDVAFAAAVGLDTLPAYEGFLRAYPNEGLAPRVRWMVAARREALTWSASLRLDTPVAYWTYMRRYPRGPHFGDVRRRLAALHASLEPPPRFEIAKELPSPTAEELSIVNRPYVVIANPGWPPIPSPPAADLPAQRVAFYQDLAPPPLALRGVLPIPIAVPLPSSTKPVAFREPGRITQPDVAGYGAVAAKTQGQAVVVSTTAGVVSRTVDLTERGNRTLLQIGSGGATLSRTATTFGRDKVTITQTGPAGDVLMREVARTAPDGALTTTTTDGESQMLSRVHTNESGVVTGITHGLVPAGEQSFVLLPRSGDATRPEVVPAAQAPAPPDPPWTAPIGSAPSRDAPASANVPKRDDRAFATDKNGVSPGATTPPAMQGYDKSAMPLEKSEPIGAPSRETATSGGKKTARPEAAMTVPLPPPRPDFRKAATLPTPRKKAAEIKRSRQTKSGG